MLSSNKCRQILDKLTISSQCRGVEVMSGSRRLKNQSRNLDPPAARCPWLLARRCRCSALQDLPAEAAPCLPLAVATPSHDGPPNPPTAARSSPPRPLAYSVVCTAPAMAPCLLCTTPRVTEPLATRAHRFQEEQSHRRRPK